MGRTGLAWPAAATHPNLSSIRSWHEIRPFYAFTIKALDVERQRQGEKR